jgi:hypothetical protein
LHRVSKEVGSVEVQPSSGETPEIKQNAQAFSQIKPLNLGGFFCVPTQAYKARHFAANNKKTFLNLSTTCPTA